MSTTKTTGKFTNVIATDESYNSTFNGATLVPAKIKVGGTEVESPNSERGFAIDAIDIDWGGLQIMSLPDNGNIGTNGFHTDPDNVNAGITSTGHLLSIIDKNFEKLATDISYITDFDLDKLAYVITLQESIQNIWDELSENGSADFDTIVDRLREREEAQKSYSDGTLVNVTVSSDETGLGVDSVEVSETALQTSLDNITSYVNYVRSSTNSRIDDVSQRISYFESASIVSNVEFQYEASETEGAPGALIINVTKLAGGLNFNLTSNSTNDPNPDPDPDPQP